MRRGGVIVGGGPYVIFSFWHPIPKRYMKMSDAEIIRQLSQAGPHVCGRLMPAQLNRTLVPAPVWSGRGAPADCAVEDMANG